MQEAQNDLSSNHGYLKYLFKRAFEKYDSESTQIFGKLQWNQWNNSENISATILMHNIFS